MLTRVAAAVVAAISVLSAAGCGGGILGRQYEYEEDLTIGIDGSATLVVNSSLAALAALRGLRVPTDSSERFNRDDIRALFQTPVSDVRRVSRVWTRKGRRFVQIRMEINDIRKLSEAAPLSWSRYEFGAKDGRHVYHQTVGPSAMKPGALKNYGWDGSEIVAFRLHLPSKILHHTARDLETNEPSLARRGNILAWEQHLADRLDGRPIDIVVEMESQSILYRTLWLFASAFLAAVVVLVLLIWWTMRKGREHDKIAA
ncbi:MAG: hypothetical protein H0W08_26775 [Acidobacteria bacterium]|nr:hypothetical protein [Acidobacteriota bacterium]